MPNGTAVVNCARTIRSTSDSPEVVEKMKEAQASGARMMTAENVYDHPVFGRNEPALHHYHNTFHEGLNLPPLERAD
jgi:hypothetical protein